MFEVRAREFRKLREIERERAKRRMSEGGGDKKSGMEISTYPVKGKGTTRDICAAAVGFTHGRAGDLAAKRRMLSGVKADPPEISPEGIKGRGDTRDICA